MSPPCFLLNNYCIFVKQMRNILTLTKQRKKNKIKFVELKKFTIFVEEIKTLTLKI
jgi:hypothetical protein